MALNVASSTVGEFQGSLHLPSQISGECTVTIINTGSQCNLSRPVEHNSMELGDRHTRGINPE